ASLRLARRSDNKPAGFGPRPVSLDQARHLLSDDLVPDAIEEIEGSDREVGVRHRRRAALESRCRRRPVDFVDTKRKRVDAAEPTGDGRLQTIDQIAAD